MRHEQTDEADDAADRDGRAGDDGRGEEADQLDAFDVHPARFGILLTERQHPQVVGDERQHNARSDQERKNQDDISP